MPGTEHTDANTNPPSCSRGTRRADPGRCGGLQLLVEPCGRADHGGRRDECGAGAGASTGSNASGDALMVADDASLGQIVTNGQGMTVYRYDMDTANSGKSSCTGSCASAWPPVTVSGSGTPTVAGVSQSLVGEITRDDGTKQLTLAGWPLYTYAGDSAAGSTSGQGVGGVWWAVTPAGAKAAAGSGGGAASPSASMGSGGGNY